MSYPQLDVPTFVGITVDSFNAISDAISKKYKPLVDLDDLKERVEDGLLDELRATKYRLVSAQIQKKLLANSGAANFAKLSGDELANVAAEAIRRTDELQDEIHHAPATAKRNKSTIAKKSASRPTSSKTNSKTVEKEEQEEQEEPKVVNSRQNINKISVREFDPSRCYVESSSRYSFEELKEFAKQLPFVELDEESSFDSLCAKISSEWMNWMIDRLKKLFVDFRTGKKTAPCKTLSLVQLKKLAKEYNVDTKLNNKDDICRVLTKRLIEYILTVRAEEYGLGLNSKEVVDMIMSGNLDITSNKISPGARLLILAMLSRMDPNLLQYITVSEPNMEMKNSVDLVLSALQLINVSEDAGGLSQDLVEELAANASQDLNSEENIKEVEQDELVEELFETPVEEPVVTKSQSSLTKTKTIQTKTMESFSQQLDQLKIKGETFHVLAKLMEGFTPSSDVKILLAPTDKTFAYVLKKLNLTLDQLVQFPELNMILNNHLIDNDELIPREPFVKTGSIHQASGIKIEGAPVLTNPVKIGNVKVYGYIGFLTTQEESDKLSIFKYKPATQKGTTSVKSPPTKSLSKTQSIKQSTPVQAIDKLLKTLRDDDKEIDKISDFREGLSGVTLNKQEQDLTDKLFDLFDQYQEINPDFDPQATTSNIIKIINGELKPVKPKAVFEQSKMELKTESSSDNFIGFLEEFLKGNSEFSIIAQVLKNAETKKDMRFKSLFEKSARVFLPTNQAMMEFEEEHTASPQMLDGIEQTDNFLLSHISHSIEQPRNAKGIDIDMIFDNASLHLTTTTLEGITYEVIKTSKAGIICKLNGVILYGAVAKALEAEPIFEKDFKTNQTFKEAVEVVKEAIEDVIVEEVVEEVVEEAVEDSEEDSSVDEELLYNAQHAEELGDEVEEELEDEQMDDVAKEVIVEKTEELLSKTKKSNSNDPNTILGYLEANSDKFSILLLLLTLNKITGDNVTIFAPDDAAFKEIEKELNLTEAEIVANPGAFLDVLKLHIVPKKLTKNQLTNLVKDNNVFLETVGGKNVELRISTSTPTRLRYSDAAILEVKELKNGTIATIDLVITQGENPAPKSTPKGKEEKSTTYANLTEALDTKTYVGFNNLLDASSAEDFGGNNREQLRDFLERKKGVTVFVPTDEVLADSYNTNVDELANKLVEVLEEESPKAIAHKISRYISLDPSGKGYDFETLKKLSKGPESSNKLKMLDGSMRRLSHSEQDGKTILSIDDAKVEHYTKLSNGYIYTISGLIPETEIYPTKSQPVPTPKSTPKSTPTTTTTSSSKTKSILARFKKNN